MPPTDRPDWVLTRRQAIGENIRAARRAAGLTQEQVGLATGIERNNVNRIEQGHASARLDSLLLIADAIGVPLADLVR
ncbi:helix-turn-helix domain-containing protein [Streptomyces sp. NBC_00237]|uniref:helix-turn-helix domain-containing protein n=1 Tax=Streptomyces sp. NBC_00237 TaxID=2975687 RepID=UPI0022524AAD|nr:helix-turn-helix transcriptional regulator [Streptomyces sp. NBC_00237]MCX5201029.1 helix-turn-helix domain-containing protein [Streptomyces sp. NBC_00237]